MKQTFFSIFWLLGAVLFFNHPTNAQGQVKDVSSYVEVEGAQLFVRTVGTGTPLIIVHGGPGMSHDYLAPGFINLFSRDYQLVFYDQRASGKSTGLKDTARLNITQFVNDLEALRKHLKIDKMNLLGHSFGGLLVMYYAIAYPDHVQKLLLLDSSPASWELNFPYFYKTTAERQTEKDKQEFAYIKQQADYALNPQLMDRYFTIYFRSFFKDPALSERLEFGIDKNWLINFNTTNDFMWKKLGKYDIHAQLPMIKASTLVVFCEASVLDIKGAEAIANKIPNSKFLLMKDVGHFPCIEAPAALKNAVNDFFGK